MAAEETQTISTNFGIRPQVFTFIKFGEAARAILEPWADNPIGPVGESPEWFEKARTFDAMIVGSTFMTPQLMDKIGPRLKVIGRTGIGVDRVDLEAATERGIMVVNTPDGPTESTAEHAVALMLALTKGVFTSDRLMHSGKGFSPYGSLPQGLEALGATLGLIGLGRIGGRVAEIARVLGMKVIAFDPFISSEKAAKLGVELAPDLASLLGQARVVSVHCPAIPETFGLINKQTLELMQPGTFFVNVSRGSLVNEKDLLEALNSGQLAGAGLDVFDPEPPEAENPLLTHPKTICTSHIGSYTEAGVLRMQVMACQEVTAALQGKRPPNLVNSEVWGRRRGF